jgi:DNA-binding NtrC family response regulator
MQIPDHAGTEGNHFMAKSAKLTILYGEGDAEILAGQAAHIEKAGHTVHQATGRKAVEQALSKGPFDLVVLGPTLTRNDRHHLPYMVKKASKETSVLVMHADGSRHPYVDACTDTGASLETVLTKIESMTRTGTKPEAAKPATSAAAAGR